MSEGFCTNKVIPKELVGNFAHLCLVMVFSFKASIKTFIREVIFFYRSNKKIKKLKKSNHSKRWFNLLFQKQNSKTTQSNPGV